MEGNRHHPGDSADRQPSRSFTIGCVAFVFLVIGYETALFVHKAAVTELVRLRDAPDTVYVVEHVPAASPGPETARTAPAAPPRRDTFRRNAPHASAAEAARAAYAPRHYERFRFDPNTVSVADLQRLGFTPKQAASIDRYRQRGGRFRRKEDFARSYVVADSVFARLEPWIDIPLLDLNAADSAALTALPGIGKYFAARIVAHRRALGGFSCPEQLLDIPRFDAERYDGLKDLVTVSPPTPYPLWTLPEDSLRLHPYIRRAARAVVRYRETVPRSRWSVGDLVKTGVFPEEDARRILRCVVEDP